MKLDSISKIQNILHKEALNKNFYSKSESELNDSANAFVDDFCTKNGLTAHTISPLRWNFESQEAGMIDDGVIELRNLDDNDTEFKYVDLSNTKLTDEDNILND